jgi:hypothetical protein
MIPIPFLPSPAPLRAVAEEAMTEDVAVRDVDKTPSQTTCEVGGSIDEDSYFLKFPI